MTDYTTRDAVEMAYDGNVAGFREAVGSILLDKIQDAVEMQRIQVAANFLAPEAETEE